MAKIIHRELALKRSLIANPPSYYSYPPVLESPEWIFYCNRLPITDRTIDFNRPDLVFIDEVNKRIVMIDIGYPLTHSLQKNGAEKIQK